MKSKSKKKKGCSSCGHTCECESCQTQYKEDAASSPRQIARAITLILNSVYSDKIDALLNYKLQENGDILGYFRDGRDVFEYTLGNDGTLTYVEADRRNDAYLEGFYLSDTLPINGRVTSYGQGLVEAKLLRTDAKKRNCKNGIPCGNTCIQKGYKCQARLGVKQSRLLGQIQASMGYISTNPQVRETAKLAAGAGAVAGLVVGTGAILALTQSQRDGAMATAKRETEQDVERAKAKLEQELEARTKEAQKEAGRSPSGRETAQAQAQAKAAQKRQKELEKELEQLKARQAGQEKRTKSEEKAVEGLEKERDEFKQKYEETKTEYDTLKKETASQEKRLTDAEAELEATKESLQQATGKEYQYKQTATHIRNQLKAVTKQLEKAKETEAENATLKGERDELQKQLKSVEKEQESANKELTKARENAEKLNKEIADAKATRKELATKAGTLEKTVKDQEKQLTQKNNLLAETQKKYIALQSENEQTKTALISAQENLKIAREQASKITQEKAQAETEADKNIQSVAKVAEDGYKEQLAKEVNRIDREKSAELARQIEEIQRNNEVAIQEQVNRLAEEGSYPQPQKGFKAGKDGKAINRTLVYDTQKGIHLRASEVNGINFSSESDADQSRLVKNGVRKLQEMQRGDVHRRASEEFRDKLQDFLKKAPDIPASPDEITSPLVEGKIQKSPGFRKNLLKRMAGIESLMEDHEILTRTLNDRMQPLEKSFSTRYDQALQTLQNSRQGDAPYSPQALANFDRMSEQINRDFQKEVASMFESVMFWSGDVKSDSYYSTYQETLRRLRGDG